MRNASGEEAEAFKFLPRKRLFLASFEIGDVDTRPKDLMNAAGTISQWNQVCVEGLSAGGQLEFAVEIHWIACFDGPTVRRDEFLREIRSEDLFHELSSDLLVR